MLLVTDLRAAVAQLHAVPLEKFVAERKRLAKELRDGGDREAAAALAKLPKPSAPAWALNRLAREEPETIAAWIEAAEALRDASTRAGEVGGDAVRAAMAAHRDATRSVLAAARDRTRPNGRELSEPMLDRVRDLLQVATLDPGETERLRAGLIVEGSEEEPSLPEGDEDGAAAAKGGQATSRSEKQTAGAGSGARATTSAAERRAEKERVAQERAAAERAELERLVADAEARLEQLRATVAEREEAAAQAEERLEEARRTLHRSESEAAAARDAVDEATDAAEQVERELRKLAAKLSS
jgi:hypothetical protein